MILFNSSTAEWQWLSNFSRHPVVDRAGVEWPTAEHAYQACKTSDAGERATLRRCTTAAAVKAAARRITQRDGWTAMRREVMGRVLKAKFTQHAGLREMLLATGDEELVHDCPWGDAYWGKCRGRGENVLGVLLMQLRAELRRK